MPPAGDRHAGRAELPALRALVLGELAPAVPQPFAEAAGLHLSPRARRPGVTAAPARRRGVAAHPHRPAGSAPGPSPAPPAPPQHAPPPRPPTPPPPPP